MDIIQQVDRSRSEEHIHEPMGGVCYRLVVEVIEEVVALESVGDTIRGASYAGCQCKAQENVGAETGEAEHSDQRVQGTRVRIRA